jgi:hypothetical protein
LFKYLSFVSEIVYLLTISYSIIRGEKRKMSETRGVGFLPFLLITVMLASILVPLTIATVNSTNTTGWDAGAVAIWDLLPLFAVLAAVLPIIAYVIREAGFG